MNGKYLTWYYLHNSVVQNDDHDTWNEEGSDGRNNDEFRIVESTLMSIWTFI